MIYVLMVFVGVALFLMGLVLGYVSPLGIKRAVKSKTQRAAKSHNEQTKEIQNFLNYDGSPQP